jgi:hypothetical protein
MSFTVSGNFHWSCGLCGQTVPAGVGHICSTVVRTQPARRTAGQLLDLADRAERLQEDLAAEGFDDLLCLHLDEVVRLVEDEAGRRAIQEMRAQSDGNAA